MMKALPEARVTPSRPAATAITTLAMAVPNAPSASTASRARVVHCACTSAGAPGGAVSTSATPSVSFPRYERQPG